MKKSIVLLLVILFLFALTGCSETEKQFYTKPESLVGYIVIKDNTLYFDEVEIVERVLLTRYNARKLTVLNDLDLTGILTRREVEKPPPF